MKNTAVRTTCSPGQNPNPEPPQYEVGVLILDHIYIYIYIYIYITEVRFKMCIPINIQQDATSHSLFISVHCSTCFGWYLHPSSGAQNCIYSIWYLSNRYCYLPLAAGSSNGLPSARCSRYSFVFS